MVLGAAKTPKIAKLRYSHLDLQDLLLLNSGRFFPALLMLYPVISKVDCLFICTGSCKKLTFHFTTANISIEFVDGCS